MTMNENSEYVGTHDFLHITRHLEIGHGFIFVISVHVDY